MAIIKILEIWQQVLVKPPRIAKNADKQLHMRGASWKPRIIFYPWANVTGRNQLHLHNPLRSGIHTETKP